MAEPPTLHRFSVEDYHRMGEAGIFREDDRVELIRGEVVAMTPIGIPHAGCVKRLNRIFARLGDRALLSIQDPVQFDHSEPQPDFALLAPDPEFLGARHPGPADVYLIVEVADSSERFDRGVKGPLYAEGGIREYWLIDVGADRIELYRAPSRDGYGQKSTVGRGDRIAPLAFPEFEVEVGDILP